MLVEERKVKRNTQASGTRHYEVPTPDGDDVECYPSVTTILSCIAKPALLHWMAKTEREATIQAAADLYEDIHSTPKMERMVYVNTLAKRLSAEKAGVKAARKAAEIGSNVHAVIEWTLRNELNELLDECPPLDTIEAQDAFNQWQAWRADVDLKPLRVEQVVWSRRHQYAGTLDLLATVNGKPAVLDWKTGKAVYPEARIQIATYGKALIEMGHADKLDGYVVRLPKVKTDSAFEAVKVPARDFNGLFDVFQAAQQVWRFVNEEAN